MPNKEFSLFRPLIDAMVQTGDIAGFTGRFFQNLFKPRFEFKEFLRQCFFIGYKSFSLVAITAFIMGLVITIQSRPTLVEFGAEAWLPKMVSVSLVREIAPVITALICAGKIGSGIGAELGSMKVTEQIDAMEVSAINPFKFLVVTRVLACTLMIPILALYCGFVGMMGTFVNVNQNEYTTYQTFIRDAFGSISFLDIYSSLFKSVVFGFTVGIVSCYQGFKANNGTEGVGRAANSAVVISMFLVFIEEIVIVQVINWMR